MLASIQPTSQSSKLAFPKPLPIRDPLGARVTETEKQIYNVPNIGASTIHDIRGSKPCSETEFLRHGRVAAVRRRLAIMGTFLGSARPANKAQGLRKSLGPNGTQAGPWGLVGPQPNLLTSESPC